MILLFNGQVFSQISWDVDLAASNTSPIRNCTPVTLTFTLVQAEFNDVPMTGITLELMLLEDVFQMVENAAGFTMTNQTFTNNGLDYEIWELTGVAIPSIDDGDTATIHVTVLQTGDIDDPDPSIFFRATYDTYVIGAEQGPLLVTDLTFLELSGTDQSPISLAASASAVEAVADVLIHGPLVADINFDFDNNYTIYMDEDALIEVEDGVELKFTNQTIVQGCVESWTGIEVLDGGKLVVDGSNDTSPNMAVIQGAEHAIIAHDGSEVLVKEAILRNNGVGIFVPVSDDGHNQIDLSVRSVTFQNDNQYPGVTAISGMEVNQMSYPVLSDVNSFINLVWGINGFRSNIVSEKDNFENCSTAGISVTGPAYTLTQSGRGLNEAKPTFVNCPVGIWAQNMNVVSGNNVMHEVATGYSLRQGIFRKVRIHDNLIRASRQGVAVNYWYSLPSFVVEDNEIYVDNEPHYGAGIFAELLTGYSIGRCRFDRNNISVGQSRHGIYLNSSDRAGLNENSVTLEFPMSNYGIQLDYTDRSNLFCNLVEGTGADDNQAGFTFSTSSLNTLSCNTVETTGRGIHYLGKNVPTTMRGTEFYSHNRALQYGWPSVSFPIGAQTGVQSHHGNRWLETYQSGDYGVGHYGTSFQIQGSQIEYDSNDEPDLQEVTLTTNEDPAQLTSLFSLLSGTTYSCSSETTGCPPSDHQFTDGITLTDIRTAQDSIDPGYFDEPQIWVAKRQLYRRLLDDSRLLESDTLIDNFFTAEAITSVGVYEALHKDIEELFVPDANDENQMEADQDSMLVRMDELQSVEELLDGDPTPQERDTLLSEKQVLMQAIQDLTSGTLDLGDTLEQHRISSAQQLLSTNANAPDNEDFEIYQRTVNRIMLEWIIDRQTELTDSQTLGLTPIANTCPFEGGPAVYQARALLGQFANYDDSTLCYVAQPLKKPKEAQQAFAFSIHPNPGNGYTVVELEQPAGEDGEISLTNSLGNVVHCQKFNKKDKTIYLIFDELPAGSYYLTIRTASFISSQVFTNLR